MTTLAAPSEALCQLLDTLFIDPPGVQLNYGRNLYRSPTLQVNDNVPAQAVFIITNGGRSPRQYLQDKSELIARVLVFVRGNVNSFGDSEDLARGVLQALHRNVPAGYIDCISDVPEPEYNGLEDGEYPLWTIPFSVTRVE